MKGKLICAVLLGLSMPLSAAPVSADSSQEQYQLQQQDMYGWEMMSPEERAAHRSKMQGMRNEAEREKYRMEHHRIMQERAKQKGIDLPEQPRGSRGSGMGGPR